MDHAVRNPDLGHAHERGFALVLVIWGLGLIALIVLAVMSAERFRIQAAANLIDNARAEVLAEAGVNLVRLGLAPSPGGGTPERGAPDDQRLGMTGTPRLCAMPGGALAVLAAEDEGGKADLNAASPKLLAALLRGLGATVEEADRLATAIGDFSRTSSGPMLDYVAAATYAADGRAYGPKQGPFESVLELDQVVGMRPDLLAAVLPFVTVHSRRPGVDPGVAAPALLAALAGHDPVRVTELATGGRAQDGAVRGVPAELLSVSTRRSFLVRAEVRMPAGGRFAQEAVVELMGGGRPDVVREWRRGRGRFGARLEAASRGANAAALPPC